MSDLQERRERFVIIGENLHCSRRLRLDGPSGLREGNKEYVVWKDRGRTRRMEIPDWFRKGDRQYEAGLVSHCRLAVELGLRGDEVGAEYLRRLAERQIEAGAHYLDLNVDEVSPEPERCREAMAWAVPVVQQAAGAIPLALDSSNPSTLYKGLEVYDFARSIPLVNSLSLERLELLDALAERDLPALVLASGEAGPPHSVEERLANLRRVLEACGKRGIPLRRLFLDVLVYPKSAGAKEGLDALLAMSAARREFGPEVRVAGGHSNFSYGLPLRSLVNAVWLELALEHGCDSGIVDPLSLHPKRLREAPRDSDAWRRVREMILSPDDDLLLEFLEEVREGRIRRS